MNNALRRFQSSAFRHFALALLVFSVSLPSGSYDSFLTIPTAMNLLSAGRTDVDAYASRVPDGGSYSLECVPADGPAVYTVVAPRTCAGGHWYNHYPFSVSLFAVPAVVLMRPAAAGLRPIFAHIAALRDLAARRRMIADFLAGDFFQAHALVEMWTASILAASAAGVLYLILARFLPAAQASLLTLIYAFGTSMWSTASRSLMQHAPSALLLSLALYQFLRVGEQRWSAGFAGFLLAAAFTVRPSDSIFVAAFTIYTAVHLRRDFWKFALGGAIVAIPFFAYNLATRHALLPSYFLQGGQMPWERAVPNGLAQLFSPSRGLFVFSPVLLVSLYGMWLAIKARWLFPLTPYLLAILAAHSVLVSFWWPGHGFGSRYFTDVTFLLVLFMAPALRDWPVMPAHARGAAAGAFITLSVFSVFVHARGATSSAVHSWNVTPVNVDQRPSRIWDWRDPQFLRGLPGLRTDQ